MKLPLLLLAALLTGCTTAPPAPKPFDFSNYEQSCDRAVASGQRSAEECAWVLRQVFSREFKASQPPPPKPSYPLGGGRMGRQGGTMIIGDGFGSSLIIR